MTRRPKAPGALLLAEAVESERIRRVVVTDERRVAELCLLRLHAGEAEAIALAEELGGVTLLIDERLGRQVAADAGLPVLGTLGALAAAADRGWPVPPAVIEHLHSLGFYATPGLLRAVRTRLAAAARRRRSWHGS
ncbi:hypothetical protein L6R50_05450 [Myxococcota bacterium]|nr:hypothetical protein [Myxococcota bacterium]